MSTHHGSSEYGRGLYQTALTSTEVERATDEDLCRDGRFGRMFEPSAVGGADDATEAQLRALGRAGGPLDEREDVDPVGDSQMPAGFTFLGQFVDHDITLDPVSMFGRDQDPAEFRNFRTPNLDLDCIYGAGPEATPHLYDRFDKRKLLVGEGTDLAGNPFDDLPRNDQGTALIGDPRNDENLIVSQLQLAFLKFHNRVVDELGEFEPARSAVVDVYHAVLVEDFLPRLIGASVTNDILNNGRRYYNPPSNHVFMPVEFSVAAYRYGHSQVRATYDLNDSVLDVALFELGGFKRPRAFVQWRYMFETTPTAPQRARRIDTRLPHVLMNLPPRVASNPASLAARNLLRGRTFNLPSGQGVAQRMIDDGVIAASAPLAPDTNVQNEGMSTTPLWYYVLQEAKEIENGERLGLVGGRIVGEVLFGLMAAGDSPYLRRRADGTPPPLAIPQVDPTKVQIVDLLRYAGA